MDLSLAQLQMLSMTEGDGGTSMKQMDSTVKAIIHDGRSWRDLNVTEGQEVGLSLAQLQLLSMTDGVGGTLM